MCVCASQVVGEQLAGMGFPVPVVKAIIRKHIGSLEGLPCDPPLAASHLIIITLDPWGAFRVVILGFCGQNILVC